MAYALAILVAAAVLAFAGTAAGAATPTPNGDAGACNVLLDPTMMPGAGGAMDHADAAGDAGMFRAVTESAGGCG